MRSRDLPFNDKVPLRLQYRIPKVKSILNYHKLQNPSVRERKEDGKLIFKVDSGSSNSSMAMLAATSQISDFLEEEVIVMIRGADILSVLAQSQDLEANE